MTQNFNQEPSNFRPSNDGEEIVTSYGIGKWLLTAREAGATHMIVVCDTYDHDDYPVVVMPEENVHDVEAEYRNSPMQVVMEVYWLGGDLDEQLGMGRSRTYGPAKTPNAV